MSGRAAIVIIPRGVPSRAQLSMIKGFAGAAGACLVMSVAGCVPWVGPLHVRIVVDGPPVDDFVIQPGKVSGGISERKTSRLAGRVVASGEEIELPRFTRGPTYVGFEVAAYHPEFRAARSFAEGGSGPIEMPPLHMLRWADYLQSGGALDAERCYNHVYAMRTTYFPALEPAALRRQSLERYLPGLTALAARAEVSASDVSRWGSAEAARRVVDEELAALAELSR